MIGPEKKHHSRSSNRGGERLVGKNGGGNCKGTLLTRARLRKVGEEGRGRKAGEVREI